MDFIVGLPKSNDITFIFVVCDRLTKYAHFLPLAHPFGAAKVALLAMFTIDSVYCVVLVLFTLIHTI